MRGVSHSSSAVIIVVVSDDEVTCGVITVRVQTVCPAATAAAAAATYDGLRSIMDADAAVAMDYAGATAVVMDPAVYALNPAVVAMETATNGDAVVGFGQFIVQGGRNQASHTAAASVHGRVSRSQFIARFA